MVGVALNVTEVPAHIGFGAAFTDTLVLRTAVTLTFKLLDALVPQRLPAVTVILPF